VEERERDRSEGDRSFAGLRERERGDRSFAGMRETMDGTLRQSERDRE
jgi:hypothetical protein